MLDFNIEKLLNFALYIIVIAMAVVIFNIHQIAIKKENKLEEVCRQQNSYLIDSSNGYYCFKPGK